MAVLNFTLEVLSFTLSEKDSAILRVNLPFKTDSKFELELNPEIVLPVIKKELEQLKEYLIDLNVIMRDLNVVVEGHLSLPIVMYLGYKLGSVCKSISLFEPRLNDYFKVIENSDLFSNGGIICG